MLLPFSNIVGSVTIRAHIDHSCWNCAITLVHTRRKPRSWYMKRGRIPAMDPRFTSGEMTQEKMYKDLSRQYRDIAAELGSPLIPVGDAFYERTPRAVGIPTGGV